MVNDRITSVKVSLVILPLLKPASDIQRIWSKLDWLGASVGRSGVARLLGAHRDSVPCCNTSGGYLSTPIDEVIANAQASLAAGIGGIKIKVGQPDTRLDLSRVASVRAALGGDVPLMGERQPAVEPNHGHAHWAWLWRNTGSPGSKSRWMPSTPTASPPWPACWPLR